MYMYVLYAIIKMEKSLMNSSYQHLQRVDPENSEKGGLDTCQLHRNVLLFWEFYKNNTKQFQGKKAYP